MIFSLKRLAPNISGVLIAVILAKLVSSLFDLSSREGISVIGALPQGLPNFQIPRIAPNEFKTLCSSALANV